MPLNINYVRKRVPRPPRPKPQPVEFYSFKRAGRHLLRLAPPWIDPDEAEKDWVERTHGGLALPVYRHQGLPEMSPPVCVKYSFPTSGRRCPFCEHIGDPKQKRVVFKYAKTPYSLVGRFYSNVLLRPRNPDGLRTDRWYVAVLPAVVYTWLVMQAAEFGLDFVLGRDVVVERRGRGRKAAFSCGFAPKPGPLHPDPETAESLVLSGMLPNLDTVFGVSAAKMEKHEATARSLAAELRLSMLG